MVGEIHLAKIYFTNAAGAKIRPVLILKPNSYNDLLFLPLTTQLLSNGILISNNELSDGFLPKSSKVVYEKIGVIDPSLLIKKIGTINPASLHLILKELIQFLSN